MWADVICIWDGLAGNLSRTLQFRIWELTFESSATRKTRLCARVCGYLESKLPLNFEQPYPPKTSHNCLQKMLLFMVLHHRNPSANSGAARLLRPWRRPCSANAEAGRCSGEMGWGVGSWKTLPKWRPFRLVKCKIVHLPLPPKIISWFHEEFASWSSENYRKIGGGSSIFVVLSSRLAALQDVVMSQCLCLPTLIQQTWQLEVRGKR